MSNEKIRRWVYRAIGFLILCSIAWFLLLRESHHTEEYIKAEYFDTHRQALTNIVTYLCDKCGDSYIDMTDLPTVDNGSFGVPSEDTDAYRAYSSGVFEVMESAFPEIIYNNGKIQFISQKSGGFLVQDYVILAYCEDTAVIKDAPQNQLAEKHWSYYIIKGKD